MSNMEIDRVLAQIRSMSHGAGSAGGVGGLRGPSSAVGGPGAVDKGFATLLKQGLDSVNQVQNKATTLQTQFERGVPGVELPQVMLEMQKANVSFRALAEVRNKFVDAYREIMNMPL